jgi:hypothetical protein
VSKTLVIRYETQPGTADENQKLIENVFADLADKNPDGLRYASFRLADGVGFVHIAILPDDADPLAESVAFKEFQRGFGDRVATGPVASQARLIGSYGFTLD